MLLFICCDAVLFFMLLWIFFLFLPPSPLPDYPTLFSIFSSRNHICLFYSSTLSKTNPTSSWFLLRVYRIAQIPTTFCTTTYFGTPRIPPNSLLAIQPQARARRPRRRPPLVRWSHDPEASRLSAVSVGEPRRNCWLEPTIAMMKVPPVVTEVDGYDRK